MAERIGQKKSGYRVNKRRPSGNVGYDGNACEYSCIGERSGSKPPQIADGSCRYQYLVQQKFPTMPIAGFENVEQIEQAVKSVECEMPPEILAQVSSLKELQK